MDSNGEEPLSNLVALPTELLVYIISFLGNIRDVVKLRYVSRRLRSVSCETPSLWREFIWPHLDNNEERCVKNLLKSCGQYIKRLSFPDHVAPSKLTAMLQNCNNVVVLSIPTSKLNPDQLRKLIRSMERLQSLDIPIVSSAIHLLLPICARLKELTIRIPAQLGNVALYQTILTEWAKNTFVPRTLNIVSTWKVSQYEQQQLRQTWLSFYPSSLSDHVGCFKVFSSLKVPMDLFCALPDFQLKFGQSCTLPFVKPSKFGLLGLREDLLLLIDFTSGSQILHKAVMILAGSHDVTYLNSDITSLNFVTHFDASYCRLYSGHLEQLAMACPNLLELNLRKNFNCLKSLAVGLRVIADRCKNLRGLNLLDISVVEVENYIQLWEILADMRLTYLAIEVCALIPRKRYKYTKKTIAGLYQKCLDLKALEFGYYFTCVECRTIADRQGELLLLSNFTSLIHIFADCDSYQPNLLQDILTGCEMLKYLNYSSKSFDSPSSTVVNNKLEQIYLKLFSHIYSTFMDSISAHGGLVHLFLYI